MSYDIYATEKHVAEKIAEIKIENIKNISTFDGYDRFYDSISRMQVNPLEPLDIVTYDGSNKPTHPKVLYFEDGWAGHKYWMTYSPFPYNDNTYENPCIAYSDDGVNFISDGIANPIEDTPMEDSTKVGYNSDPHLVLVGDIMECWWRTHYQSGTNAEHEVIYRKTSSDGITWSEKEELYRVHDASAGSCLSPAIIYEDGLYKIWFVYRQQVMKYCESTTGTDWTFIRDIHVDNPDYPCHKVWHIDVIHTNKGYEFVGCYHPIWDYNDNRYVYYAVSEDNVTYSKPVLILTQGELGNFDSSELYRPSILRQDNKVMVYYGCRNGYGNWRIGMIESPNPYLFNAVLESGRTIDNRLPSIEARILALESGDTTADTDIANSLESSTWTAGYYNDSGELITTTSENLNMHYSQLIPIPTDNKVHTISHHELYLRIVYFDADKNFVTFDRGYGLGVAPTSDEVVTDIVINKGAGAYYIVCANAETQARVFYTISEPQGIIAKYIGSDHGETEGEWSPVIGDTNAVLTGGTWSDGILALDGVDDMITLPLKNARSVIIKMSPQETYVDRTNLGYIFDCRPTASAYMLNYDNRDYVGLGASVYANDVALTRDEGVIFGNHVTAWYWHEFSIVFTTEFTGDMIIAASYLGADFMQCKIEYIEVYDTNVRLNY